jgi:hypothetical protein
VPQEAGAQRAAGGRGGGGVTPLPPRGSR